MSLPSLSLSAPSAATATSGANGNVSRLGTTQTSGGDPGNRGFINNFAAAGASLTADQGINPPALDPSRYTWLIPILLIGAIVGLVVWRKYGPR